MSRALGSFERHTDGVWGWSRKSFASDGSLRSLVLDQSAAETWAARLARCMGRFRCRRGSALHLLESHIDRRQQFEIRTHKRLIDIVQATASNLIS